MTDGDHISDLRWDRLLAGELASQNAAQARAHAEQCKNCGERFRALSAARDAFADRPLPMSFVPRRRSRRALWLGGGTVMMAAAAVLLVVLRPGTPPAERSKGGGPILIVAASRAGVPLALVGGPGVNPAHSTPPREGRVIVPLSTGDAVHPGDLIQIGYSSDRDGFGAVIARDGSGGVMAYVPSQGAMLVALPAGRDRSFPESTILDAVVGTETLHVVWCETSLPLEPLLVEVRGGALEPRVGCTHRTLVLQKSSP